MKILYDHQAFTYQNWGGVSKCFCELINNRPNGDDYDIAIKETDNHHLLESGLVDHYSPLTLTFGKFHSKHSIIGREKIYNFLSAFNIIHTAEYVNKKESIKKIRMGGFDVFHPTFFDTYFLPYIGNKPFVITIHDLMPEIFGWYKKDPQIINKPILCEKATAIIAVSENTKRDLCRYYNVPSEKVHVVYHGAPVVEKTKCFPRIIDEPYFLYVGGRGGYKNFVQTIDAFGNLHKKYPEVKFIFTGGQFSTEENNIANSYGLRNSIITLFATDQQLASLYSNAIAFVYPSLYEGFGMPILEAFSYNCPVILNNKSCFPEIAGDAALYFDSDIGAGDLENRLLHVYNMSAEERNEMVCSATNRLSMFSWEKSSKQLSQIYETLI